MAFVGVTVPRTVTVSAATVLPFVGDATVRATPPLATVLAVEPDPHPVAGFVGWQTWAALRTNALANVPAGPAVYVVYRAAATKPSFLAVNPGGHFKEKDPTVPFAELQANWVPDSRVIYIGKADAARKRLAQFAQFGAGQKIGHWGGRYIWQLADSVDQLVAWHPISWGEEANVYEKRLFAHFAELHDGARPFANLTGATSPTPRASQT